MKKKVLFIELLISVTLLFSACTYVDYCPVCVNNMTSSEVKNVTISWIVDGQEDNLIFENVPANSMTDWYSAIIDESRWGIKEKSTAFAVTYEKDGVTYDIKNSASATKIGNIYVDDLAVLSTDEKITIRIQDNSYSILKK